MLVAFRRTMYEYASRMNYNKLENIFLLVLNSFLLAIFLVGTMPTTVISAQNQQILRFFYGITVILLINARIFWRWYNRRRGVGFIEVVSNYVNIVVIVILFSWISKMSKEILCFWIFMVIIFFIFYISWGVWCEYQKKEKKLLVYALYCVSLVAIIMAGIYMITTKDIFIEISLMTLGMLASPKLFLYWLILDTPYRRNLIKEFGPEDIDKSAIFVSKKKKKNK